MKKTNNIPFLKFFLQLAMTLVLIISTFNCLITWKNTLAKKKEWISTKTLLNYMPMDSLNFVQGSQSLSENRLNLGTWHGHQEEFYAKEIHPKAISFSFTLADDSYLVFLIRNKNSLPQNSKNSYGIRLSRNLFFPSAFLQIGSIDNFINKTEMKSLKFKNGSNICTVFFQEQGLAVYLNNEKVYSANIVLDYPISFGLRSGASPVSLDNIKISLFNGNRLEENFSPSLDKISLLATFFAFILLLFLDIYLFNSKKFPNTKQFYFSTLSTKIFLFILVMILNFVWVKHFSKLYPKDSVLSRDEKLEEEGKFDEVEFSQLYSHYFKQRVAEINMQIEQIKQNKDEKDFSKIIFLGSSQTWGEGASSIKSTWVEKVCSRISENQALKIICLNAGIRAARSVEVYKYYNENFVKFKPQICLINLGNNDYYPENSLISNLSKIIELNKKLKIKTFLMLEANDPEEAIYTPLHFQMIKLAEEKKIPFINTPFLLTQHLDEGFMWWDYVHLTDFGQDLLSKITADFINSQLMIQ